MKKREQINDVNRLVLLDRSASLEAAGLGELRNGVIYVGERAVEAVDLFNSLPPVLLAQNEDIQEKLVITESRGEQ